MQQKRVRVLLNIVCYSFLGVLTGCYSSQQLVQPSLSQKVSHNPEFLNNLSLAGNNSRGLVVSTNNNDYNVLRTDKSLADAIQIKYSSLLSVLPRAIKNIPVYNFINEWYGVRYRLGGNDKQGIDCSAFVQRFYEQVFGINLVRTAFQQFNKSNLLWDNEDLKEGDLVFFRVHSSRISHVGIYLMNNCFVHASSSQGVMISSLNDKYWQKYFACGGRVL